jgi:hypothetical protein
MRCPQRIKSGGPAEFFRLTLSHEGLVNYYQLNFSLINNHNYSLSELENMIPWERDIYVTMLINYVNEQNEKLKHKKI